MPIYQIWQNTQDIPNILSGCWNYQNKNLASAYLATPERPALKEYQDPHYYLDIRLN